MDCVIAVLMAVMECQGAALHAAQNVVSAHVESVLQAAVGSSLHCYTVLTRYTCHTLCKLGVSNRDVAAAGVSAVVVTHRTP